MQLVQQEMQVQLVQLALQEMQAPQVQQVLQVKWEPMANSYSHKITLDFKYLPILPSADHFFLGAPQEQVNQPHLPQAH